MCLVCTLEEIDHVVRWLWVQEMPNGKSDRKERGRETMASGALPRGRSRTLRSSKPERPLASGAAKAIGMPKELARCN